MVVLAVQKAMHHRGPLGQGAEHDGAVGNRLVAGNDDLAAQGGGGLDGTGFHKTSAKG
jgi:hypothetical protein